jgi:hypothetical protein
VRHFAALANPDPPRSTIAPVGPEPVHGGVRWIALVAAARGGSHAAPPDAKPLADVSGVAAELRPTDTTISERVGIAYQPPADATPAAQQVRTSTEAGAAAGRHPSRTRGSAVDDPDQDPAAGGTVAPTPRLAWTAVSMLLQVAGSLAVTADVTPSWPARRPTPARTMPLSGRPVYVIENA